LETFGSGGQDAWGGEYEEVLDFGGDEKDANVIGIGYDVDERKEVK